MHFKIKYNIIIKSFINKNLFWSSNASKYNYLKTLLKEDKYSKTKKASQLNKLHTHKTNKEKTYQHIYIQININYYKKYQS